MRPLVKRISLVLSIIVALVCLGMLAVAAFCFISLGC